MNSRKILLLAALLGASTVALGAFGAHGLREKIEAHPKGTEYWRMATDYALPHAAALVGLAGFASKENPGRLLTGAARCWFFGAIVFSGTLMAMALGAPKWLGAVTPLGGAALIAGWALAGFAALKRP